MRRLLFTTILAAGCVADDFEIVDPGNDRIGELASCGFENEDDPPDEYDPSQDGGYSFTGAANFPKEYDTDFIDYSRSYVKIATSVDNTYRPMASVHEVSYPYDRDWYWFIHFGDGLQRFAAFIYIKGGEFWDDDREWMKFKIKMTSVDGDTCTSKSRTVWVDD